jgi:hypothetical protein
MVIIKQLLIFSLRLHDFGMKNYAIPQSVICRFVAVLLLFDAQYKIINLSREQIFCSTSSEHSGNDGEKMNVRVGGGGER